MSRTMTQWPAAGVLGLAAMAGALALATTTKPADAAPKASQFAGGYHGYIPGYGSDWDLGIDAQGKVQSVPAGESSPIVLGFSGKVDSKSRVSCSGSWSAWNGASGTIDFTAAISKDASGNIAGTTTAGQSFVWYRY